MTKKRVTFAFEFEYDVADHPEKDDADFEEMAFDVLRENLHDVGRGTVETIDDADD
jgi:hypothetical protein